MQFFQDKDYKQQFPLDQYMPYDQYMPQDQYIQPQLSSKQGQQQLVETKLTKQTTKDAGQQSLRVQQRSKVSQKEKEQIQKTLAQKFITLGYGYAVNMKAVKKRHNFVITSPLYNNIMTTVVRRAFRALQTFLMTECKQTDLKTLSHYQCSLIRSPMVQCTKWLSKEELNTLYKFIMRSYSLKKVYISQDQASRLYGQLVQSSKKEHQVSHIILHRNRKQLPDPNAKEGIKVSYVPSGAVAINRT